MRHLPLRRRRRCGVARARGHVVQGAVAAAPVAITGTVSAIGGTTATLNGTVNPAGAATDWWFEYGTSTSYGSKTATDCRRLGLGERRRLEGAERSRAGDDVPLPTRRQELLCDDERRRWALHDGFAAGCGHVAGDRRRPDDSDTRRHREPERSEPTTWYVEYGTSTSYGTKTATADAGSGHLVESGLDGRHRPHRRQDVPLPARRARARRGRPRRRRDVRDGRSRRASRRPPQARSDRRARS